ncbi:MAG: hypothetical protein WC586_01165 [Methanoregula sp.]
MVYNQSEESVSHITGVILVITALIILAGVVIYVVFAMGGTHGLSKAVAITGQKSTSGIVFSVQGGADLGSVTTIDLVSGSTITNCTGRAPKVGQGCTVGTDSNGRTVLVATFADGSKQVVFDKNWGSVVSSGSTASDYYTIVLTRTGGPLPADYTITLTSATPGPKSADAVYDWYENGSLLGTLTAAQTDAYVGQFWFSSNEPAQVTVYARHPDTSTLLIYDHTFTAV